MSIKYYQIESINICNISNELCHIIKKQGLFQESKDDQEI